MLAHCETIQVNGLQGQCRSPYISARLMSNRSFATPAPAIVGKTNNSFTSAGGGNFSYDTENTPEAPRQALLSHTLPLCLMHLSNRSENRSRKSLQRTTHGAFHGRSPAQVCSAWGRNPISQLVHEPFCASAMTPDCRLSVKSLVSSFGMGHTST